MPLFTFLGFQDKEFDLRNMDEDCYPFLWRVMKVDGYHSFRKVGLFNLENMGPCYFLDFHRDNFGDTLPRLPDWWEFPSRR